MSISFTVVYWAFSYLHSSIFSASILLLLLLILSMATALPHYGLHYSKYFFSDGQVGKPCILFEFGCKNPKHCQFFCPLSIHIHWGFGKNTSPLVAPYFSTSFTLLQCHVALTYFGKNHHE